MKKLFAGGQCAAIGLVVAGCLGGVASPAQAQVFDLVADWSETANPNGAWTYMEGSNPLPHVDWWQRQLGGWTSAQPGWARSEDANTRLPFWFKSNGTEVFNPDFVAGDVVVHSTDGANGVGAGIAAVQWVTPVAGRITITGAVWPSREIGRSNTFRLYAGGTLLRTGSVASGDVYSRANPLQYAGASGAESLSDRVIGCNGVVRLEVERTSEFGDFVGVKLNIAFTPTVCAGDFNADGVISTPDLTQLLVQFGQTGTPLCADLDHNGTVNTADLVVFLSRFGTACP